MFASLIRIGPAFLLLFVVALPSRGAPSDTTADAVLGQSNFTSDKPNQGNAAASQTSINELRGLDTDPTSDRLWVCDTMNHRVLSWPSARSFRSGDAADIVLGQANFTDNKPNRDNVNPDKNTLNEPRSLAFDPSGRLYVADSKNFRILRFDPPFSNGMDAKQVFGQGGSFTTGNQPNTASADNLGNPDGVACDKDGNLYCADRFFHRVLRFDTPAANDNTTADIVIGQANFTSGMGNRGNAAPSEKTLLMSIGCCTDVNGNLYVADEGNNRVLRFNAPLSSDQSAAAVYGQPDFTSNTGNNGGRSESSLLGPVYVAIDPNSGRLYVADAGNSRILEYNDPLSSTTANRVFGQGGDFASGDPNKGGVSANSLNDVAGVACDDFGNLFAGDRLNHRVLRFNAAGGCGACGLCGPGVATMMPLTLAGMICFRRRSRRRGLK
jgi:sugar lactone lactonase YvrE